MPKQNIADMLASMGFLDDTIKEIKPSKEKPCTVCTSCKKVTAFDGFSFLGCFHEPYRGKRVREIKVEDCPMMKGGDE